MREFIKHHHRHIRGVLSGFDRIRIRGTLRWLASVAGMRSFMAGTGLLLKDFTHYANNLTKQIRDNTVALTQAADRPIQYINSSSVRKEDIARDIARRDNIDRGLICVLTCVEPCFSYVVYRNRQTRQLELRGLNRKCLHQYFYLIHEQFGFMHLRLQTWLPMNIHMCINGREWLVRQLDAAGIGYIQRDNCLVDVEDVDRAQALLGDQPRADWPTLLDDVVRQYHPTHAAAFAGHPIPYYWSADQTEWATDVMFKSPAALARIYPQLVHHSMLSLSSVDVMRFLGRPVPAHGGVHGHFAGQVSSDMKHRPEGVRVCHRLNGNAVKMYDKQGSVLRVETTINDARDMKAYRRSENDNADSGKQWRRLRKGVSDLPRRTQISQSANTRYLHSLASAHHGTTLGAAAAKLCKPAKFKGRRARALNPLALEDVRLLEAISRGEFAINGFRNRDMRVLLFKGQPADDAEARRRCSRVTRQLRLLRAHGLIRKVSGTHRYVLTKRASTVIAALLAARHLDAQQMQRLAA